MLSWPNPLSELDLRTSSKITFKVIHGGDEDKYLHSQLNCYLFICIQRYSGNSLTWNISLFKRHRLTYTYGTEDAMSQSSTQVGQVGGTRIRWFPQWVNPPGSDRYQGAGQGQQRGLERTRETTEEEGTRHREQRRAVEAGRWRVWLTSKWTEFRAGRGRG